MTRPNTLSVLEGKQVVLGVSGGIAAYKSVELLRLLQKEGAVVRVVMTENARKFVGVVTFEALSKQPVWTHMFQEGRETNIQHVDWAGRTDAVVVAPATANVIAKMAHGMADDPLSTFLVAVDAPVLVCPAMNSQMYDHSATRRNLAVLKADGRYLVAPGNGPLACGVSGAGRLADPSLIADRVKYVLTPKDMVGKRVLVTAGPTREDIDPVRYISNPSTGKMGYAIARAAEYRGAAVTLISGPTALAPPQGVDVVQIRSAREMADAVFNRLDDTDIIIKSAAVSDYTPQEPAEHKIKKGAEQVQLVLRKTTDILQEIGRRKTRQVLVGFAAETRDLAENAADKLTRKHLDMVVANLVNQPGSGFGTDTNQVSFFFSDGGREDLPPMTKDQVADRLLDRVLER